MNNKENTAALEAVLFASGEPISIDRLCGVFDVSPEKIVELANALSDELVKRNSAMTVLRLENTYQLATKEIYAEYVKKAFDIKRRAPLSPAALEVLAVVAYNQPVTKAFIEQVRGVDCSGVVTTLVEKELIEERGRLELPGRPLLYGTTKNFLKCFSLSDLSELPPLPNAPEVENDVGEQLKIDDEQGSSEENP